ncbi:MAG: type I DNA topoisomerase [Clostridia bacterium]
MKKLVIVESPSKAKTIKKYLGKDFEVVASVGHLIDLPTSKLGVDVEDNFKPSYSTMKGKNKVLKDIKDKAKHSDYVYLASDPDREGEAIAWHIKNALKIKDDEKCRITFNEITKKAVTSAIDNARTIDMDVVDAQQARRVLDRIVGYKLSPLLWKKIRKGLSAGRVQSVALRIIIDREHEIENFKPEEYWKLSALLKAKKATNLIEANFYGTSKGRIDLKTQEEVKKVLETVEKADYIIKDIKKGEKKKNPPPPFTTSTLQQEASRKLNYSIKKTMMLAQNLYEAGKITYMRTDSVRISQEAKELAKNYIVTSIGKSYYIDRTFKTKKDAQDAHEAVRPTSLDVPIDSVASEISPDAAKLYKLIINRFLASQMAEAIYSTMQVNIDANGYIFRLTGSNIKFDGYMKLYIEGRDDDKDTDEECILPEFNVGDILKLKELKPDQKFTEPPARYTEATLVKTLEEKGIGRPSTYAPTINTILDRLYIEKDKKQLVPTDLGKIVNEMMVTYFKDVVNLKFTAEMEEKLDDVAEGKQKYADMLKEFYFPFMENLENVEDKIEKVKIVEEVSDVKCDLCGAMMVIKTGRYGKFLACPKFPECKNAKPILEFIDVPCPKCNAKVAIKKSKKGRKFYVCENSPGTCDYISWDPPKKPEENK